MDSGNVRHKAYYSEQQIRNALVRSGVRVSHEIASHFIVFCIYHANDNTPAGEVDKETGQFYCFSCQSTTDLPHLIAKASGQTIWQAIRLIGDTDYNIVDVVNDNLKEEVEEPFDQAIIDKLHSQVWGVGSEYLNRRNINDRSILGYQIGYSENQRMVTVPVHYPTGSLAGFVGRSIEGKAFKNNRGLQKSKLLFNLHRVWTSPTIYVVESSFDAIRLGQANVPAVATLGAGISQEQIDLLRRSFDDIVLIPDRDIAGEAMTKKIQKFIPYVNIWTLPDDAHDVGDLTDEALCGII
jgi:Toprim-like